MPKWSEVDKEYMQRALKRRENIEELYKKLLSNIKAKLPELEALLKEISGEWAEIDCIYRYYHTSFKVYYIQNYTIKMVDMFKSIAPDDYPLNEDFMEIIKGGTGKEFEMKHNQEWGKHTRPLLEAFFHAKYFLSMIVRYSDLEEIPHCLPSGVAGLLYLYNLR